MPPTLDLTQRLDGWHITGLPDEPGDCGPYDTRAEAASDRAGLLRFYRHADKPDFWSTEPCRQTESQATLF